MAEQTIQIDGINYYTLYEQPPDTASKSSPAPCVLLIHALGANHTMYDSIVPALHAAGYATLRYDHIGHNNTPCPAKSTSTISDTSSSSHRRVSQGGKLVYHADDLTTHAHHLVRARTGQSWVKAVVGCSIGGVLALRYGMLFLEDVDCILSVAAPGLTSPADKRQLWSDRIKILEEDNTTGRHELAEQTAARWFPGEGPDFDAVRAKAFEQLKTCSLGGYCYLADAIRWYDFEADLQAGKLSGTKCLIAGGSADGAISLSELERIAGLINGAEFVKFEGVGHLPPMQNVEEFKALMLKFFGGA